MSIKTSFHNSLFSAYRDLATFGPMERAMYERYTDITNAQKQQEKQDDKNCEKNKLSFSSLLFIFFLIFLLIVFVFGYYGINPLFFMYK
jgi:hypothetical protein